MDPSQAGEPAPESGNPELREIFDREIAREENRKRSRILVAGFVSLFLVILLCGIYLGSLPASNPVPGSPQPPVMPAPGTTGLSVTPFPGTTSPADVAPTETAGDMAGVITGKANPGFPYWSLGTITYSFDPAYPCSVARTGKFLRAFRILDDKTGGVVSFVSSPGGSLSISCHDSLGALGVSGWSSPEISPAGLISRATIDMYRLPPGVTECDVYPTLEMRELLHVLGFEDTSSPGNLMYMGTGESPQNPCGELDAGIVNCLKNIYSNGKKGQACTGIPHR